MNSSIWQDVVKTAIVGTGRQALKSPPNNQLGEVLSRLDTSNPEAALLSAAGAIFLYQRAGKLPPKEDLPLLEACEPEELPRCSDKAGRILARMLSGEHAEFLPEWLALAKSLKKRVPSKYLFDLLDYGQGRIHLHKAILPVLGQRGLWFAKRYPYSKNWVCQDINLTSKKVLFLQQLRATHPAAAIEKLISTWDQEEPSDKAALLATFKTGLSMEDEWFLELALDDSSLSVKRMAVELLARLPESELKKQVLRRLNSLLKLKYKQNKPYLVVNLPYHWDEKMTRYIFKTHISKVDEKAVRLLEMLAIIPPNFWCESWNLKPDELVEAAKSSESGLLLIEGWARASIRYLNADWAKAMLVPESKPVIWGKLTGYFLSVDHLINELVQLLSKSKRREIFAHNVLASTRIPLQQALSQLRYFQFSWSAELTRAVLNELLNYLQTDINPDYASLIRVLPHFARYMEPCVVVEAFSFLPPPRGSSRWVKAFHEFLSISEFRHEIIQGLRGEEN